MAFIKLSYRNCCRYHALLELCCKHGSAFIFGTVYNYKYKKKRCLYSNVYLNRHSRTCFTAAASEIKSGASSLTEYPKFHIGYEVGRFDILDLTEFYFKVLGLKLIIIVIAFLIVPNRKKILFLILSVPFVLANLLQLGVVLYDNNKLMISSLIFINCLAAYYLVELFRQNM